MNLLRTCLLAAVAIAAAAAAEPVDATRRYLGMNANFAASWASDHPFADVGMVSRMVTLASWSQEPARDADGHPASDFRWIALEANSRPGTYRLAFTGSATVAAILGTATVANLAYDAAANTTTAEVVVTSTGASCMIDFTGTRRTPASPTGSGITGLRLYQPGSPVDGSRLLGEAFAAQVRRTQVLRVMNWQGANGNGLVRWADRVRPGVFTQRLAGLEGGVAVEHLVRAANEAGRDLWLCLPVKADDEVMRKTAQAILFGSDGREPYAGPVASPRHPPLDPGLAVYIEYGNEVWNSAAGFRNFYWVKELADAVRTGAGPHPIRLGDAGDADQWTMFGRYWAWRAAEASRIVRQVAGDAQMMTRVRPVLACQAGGGWLDRMIPFLRAHYAAGRDPGGAFPPRHFFYGLGGTSYFYADEAAVIASGAPADYLAAIRWDALSTKLASEALWARDAGMRHLLYEGGNHPASGSTVSEALWARINGDAGAYGMVRETQRRVDGAGVDLAVYFQVTGGAWAFAPAIDVLDSPKYRAIDDLMAGTRDPLLIGSPVPGVIDIPAATPRQQSGWNVAGDPAAVALNSGGFLTFLVRAAAAGSYRLRFAAKPLSGSMDIAVWVGDRRCSTATLTADGWDQAATVDLTLPAGLSALRIVDEGRRGPWTAVRSIAVSAIAGPANLAPQVSAGPDRRAGAGAALALAGTAVDDGLPAGGALAVAWTQVSGPATAAFAAPGAAATTATFPVPGAYLLRLAASDGALAAADEVLVEVEAPAAPGGGGAAVPVAAAASPALAAAPGGGGGGGCGLGGLGAALAAVLALAGRRRRPG